MAGAVAIVAGAEPVVALRIGAAMTALQFGIGATNDLVDAPNDVGRVPAKPIPGGLVPAGSARIVAVGSFATGLVLAVPSGPALVALAVVVVGIGLAYDLRAKGTAWSWLPFAVGIPILPVFGWVGAGSALPAAFAVLVPAAVAAGAALAIGNALVDVDRDRAAGISSVAVALGETRSALLRVALVAGVSVAAVISTAAAGADGLAAGIVGLAAGLPLVAAIVGGRSTPAGRGVAWTLEAIGFGILGVAWIVAVLGAGRS